MLKYLMIDENNLGLLNFYWNIVNTAILVFIACLQFISSKRLTRFEQKSSEVLSLNAEIHDKLSSASHRVRKGESFPYSLVEGLEKISSRIKKHSPEVSGKIDELLSFWSIKNFNPYPMDSDEILGTTFIRPERNKIDYCLKLISDIKEDSDKLVK